MNSSTIRNLKKVGKREERPCFWMDGHTLAAWSTSMDRGFTEPPPLGTKVRVTFNELGTGTVVGYFVEAGFLGVEVDPDHRPDWHVKQNPGRCNYHVFGAEIEQV